MVSYSDLAHGRAQIDAPSSPPENVSANYENRSVALPRGSGTSLRANEQNVASHSGTLIELNSSLIEPNYESDGESSPINITNTAAETEGEFEDLKDEKELERTRKTSLQCPP